jgi:hypothetical protein
MRDDLQSIVKFDLEM